ncbi:hypothetical protein [uncultured Roseobacter sp.]|uniref:hypothetical protein n=1 Tax=uncultured Roseobacter sp. TaxID=114847 RepID=UPI0026224D82|nr:hypothetical protein [uncultured Roseobacter sp.]
MEEQEVKAAVRKYLRSMIIPAVAVVGIVGGGVGFLLTRIITTQANTQATQLVLADMGEIARQTASAKFRAEEAAKSLVKAQEQSMQTAERLESFERLVAVGDAIDGIEAKVVQILKEDPIFIDSLVGEWFPVDSMVFGRSYESCPSGWAQAGRYAFDIADGDDQLINEFGFKNLEDTTRSFTKHNTFTLFGCIRRSN